MTTRSCIESRVVDTLILGGSAMGCSTAFHLAQMMQQSSNCQSSSESKRKIVVLEPDPSLASGSAVYSAGGIRQQFSVLENVQMSQYGIQFLKQNRALLETVQFVEHGYLFLASTPEGSQQLIENNTTQRNAGCTTTQLYSPTQLRQKFPWLHVQDIELGSYGTADEGWFDPHLYIQQLKRMAQALGVEFVTAKAVSAERDPASGRITSVHAVHSQRRKPSPPHNYVFHVTDSVVNAAGAYAGTLLQQLAGQDQILQYPLPVKPRKRCIFAFHSAAAASNVPPWTPLTVDPHTNVYFRSERDGTGNFLCGVSPPENDDRDCYDLDHQHDVDHALFDDIIWPALYHRVPEYFDAIKVTSSWAGLYEYNTYDQNAIIDIHPEFSNLFLVNGFSGHGLQHSMAAGRAVAELIENDNQFISLDLNIFRFDRIRNQQLIVEKGIV
jgi:FAD-dependent oxidoreductase domain-containing protein 1